MERSARRLATLVPALLCAIWSLVLAPAATADPAPAPATHAPRTSPARAALPVPPAPEARTLPASPGPAALPLPPDPPPAAGTAPASAPVSSDSDPTRTTPAPPARTAPAPGPASAPAPAHRIAPPEPYLAPAAVAGLPAAVEHSVRFPAAPAAPAAAALDLSLPPRGLLAGDPRRERAPPGGPHVPRDPRGPPPTRHS
ncbi:hypothetical protein [Streptomyces sp. NRRL F-6491]|uniref:hypothetical protein n=1 Tax=Streptomyces sp. NRRL F-6491 TaxID=1519495 RepID=UPI0006AE2775|nr:hypothetical protein [Streptomyces sp. NRRL F-6491]KOX24717.1 hypothetical protein ADL06_21015 [Streptomyces sp. NRRL F-6491]